MYCDGSMDGGSYPVCPHCDEPHENWYDEGGFELDLKDQDEWTIACSDCKKSFTFIVEVCCLRAYTNKGAK